MGSLQEHAVLYSDRATVDNQPVCRTLSNGAMLVAGRHPHAAARTTRTGRREKAIGIPIDTRTCVPSLIVPGDWVSFLVPVAAAKAPTRAVEDANGQGNGQLNPIPDRRRGVFRVRRGRSAPSRSFRWGTGWAAREVLRAAKVPQIQENVMMISVGLKPNGQLQDDAQTLWDLVWAGNARGLGVVLHERQGPGR